eukprot:CAMPEP_0185263694 /NCGR_PEP_ID=MMETSP1359-20130426/15792_1 /TAXON_ID=552665 /ORGANISM="Bigelowiella longifila, Strain CCMP242" /LENGTH=215 /DNA_ID=CAMNT_0027851391 /DNA_START=14 /DNA_END=661 /DNA_ORIENTATION=-
MADDDGGAGALVMPSLVPYEDEDGEGQDDGEEKKAIKKKKEKKKKKKKRKQKGKKADAKGVVSAMALPSVETLMSSNDLPDFLETAAKKKKEDELARIAEIQAMKHNDSASNLEQKPTSQQPTAAGKKPEQNHATTKRSTPAAAIAPAANRKRRASSSSGGPDIFQGLHPWAQGVGALRQKKVKEQQRKKVARGQTFEGRTWKSEAEMVLRQQYD